MPEPLSAERLAEIRAREAAATPSPWTWTADGIRAANGDFVFWPANIPGGDDLDAASAIGACGLHAEEHAEDNLAFLAAARQDVPDMLGEVDRLTAEVERLRANAHAMSTAHRENWRRLFLDGGGNLFVDVCTDTDGTILVAPCHPDSFGDEQPLEELEAEHGILTRIGLVS